MTESKTVVDERKDRIEQIRDLLRRLEPVLDSVLGETVTFNERKQELFCRVCRYRDPLVSGTQLHDDHCSIKALHGLTQELEKLLASGEVDRLASSSAQTDHCIACAEGNHQLCLGGKCQCIHSPAFSVTTGWQLRAKALIDKWRATANHNVDPGYLNDCADDLEAVVKAETCR